MIARAIDQKGGKNAVSLRIAEQFIQRIGSIFQSSDTSVLPYDLATIQSLATVIRGEAETSSSVRNLASAVKGGEPSSGKNAPGKQAPGASGTTRDRRNRKDRYSSGYDSTEGGEA
jgi:hypothetical protein